MVLYSINLTQPQDDILQWILVNHPAKTAEDILLSFLRDNFRAAQEDRLSGDLGAFPAAFLGATPQVRAQIRTLLGL